MNPPQKPQRPKAPAMYRPNSVPKVLQRKIATPSPPNAQPKNAPKPPPVYRPQTPIVLQRKTVSTARTVAAPPVYRPQAKKIVQPKMTAAVQNVIPAKTQSLARSITAPTPVKAGNQPTVVQRTAARTGPAAGKNVIQRVVPAGLQRGTYVVSRANGKQGTIVSENAGERTYEVMFLTTAQPPLFYAIPLAYDALDLVPGRAPRLPHSVVVRGQDFVAVPPPAVGIQPPAPVAIQPPAPVAIQPPAPAAIPPPAVEEMEDEAFDGMIGSLPQNVTIAGVPMQWVETDRTWILKPMNGSDYPHVTFMGKTDLRNLHFSHARYIGGIDRVRIVRKGYCWNGKNSKLVDEPESKETTQELMVTGNAGGVVTFDLSGGKKGQRVLVAAPAVAVPSVAEMADALGLPH